MKRSLMQQSEVDTVNRLKKQGYTVEISNANATAFNQKYHVYKKSPMGNKLVILDAKGNITALQG